MKTMERVAPAFMNITCTRPVALFERKTLRFFVDRWKFTGNPRQSRKPRSSTRRNVERIGIVHRTRSRSRTNACSRLWYRSFQRGPLNRNDQPERRPILFPSSITGDPPRADTNRAKIKDAPANIESRPAALDFRAKKARIALQGQGTRRREEASFYRLFVVMNFNYIFHTRIFSPKV